ncbi:hypothetical protein GCM10025883_15010 [Mobilicoccus caccae]|uniref:PASTA domain-containing protein n=1 Tax=Mobilicoccus caccae TaxID=1859295 RepID=A0ABQ6IPT2_9MICO|nr:hypothetical protein GCM10025883_15010 [Mobilicoccus caccae]
MSSAGIESGPLKILEVINESGWPTSLLDLEKVLRRAGLTALPTVLPGFPGAAYVVPELNGGHVTAGSSHDLTVETISIVGPMDGGREPSEVSALLRAGLSEIGYSLSGESPDFAGVGTASGDHVQVDGSHIDGWPGTTNGALLVSVTRTVAEG